MLGNMNTKRAEQILSELTNLPTAAAREDRVIAYIQAWASTLDDLEVKPDPHGNLTVLHTAKSQRKSTTNPLYITAHLDHPAFVVTEVASKTRIEAEFRGGVTEAYFTNTPVTVITAANQRRHGRITKLSSKTKQPWSRFDVTITLDKPATDVAQDDVAVWKLPRTSIQPARDRVYAPVCDDLAAAAAVLASFEQLAKTNSEALAWTRLLFTRAEEVGFVGALGACRSKTMPMKSSIIALENSKAFAESPIGAGPVIRVGDRTRIFDHELTYRITQFAERLVKETAKRKQPFMYQRKLMTGGVCEATVFCEEGYHATCVCLPLGNYHNMNERTQKIAREIISLKDYHRLITLLTSIAANHEQTLPRLSDRLDELWDKRRQLLA